MMEKSLPMQELMQALESFFQENSGEMVEYLEAMMYEWYQHYAQEHHDIDHINRMFNSAFKVNDLLLKLNDAMIELKKEQGRDTGNLQSDHYDYRYAS